MKIILLSTPSFRDREIDVAVNLFQMGLEIFHLRKPGFSVQQTREYLERIPVAYHSRIILHHHHRLADSFGLMGVHFTESLRIEKSRKIPEIRQQRPRIHLSASFHNMSDIMLLGSIFDYVFLSPVFDSISKENYKAAFDPDDLKAFLKSAPVKVIALGGVEEKRIETVRALGFDGAAVLGAVWNAENPVNAWLKIKKAAEAA